jgi:transcription termination factor Rho
VEEIKNKQEESSTIKESSNTNTSRKRTSQKQDRRKRKKVGSEQNESSPETESFSQIRTEKASIKHEEESYDKEKPENKKAQTKEKMASLFEPTPNNEDIEFVYSEKEAYPEETFLSVEEATHTKQKEKDSERILQDIEYQQDERPIKTTKFEEEEYITYKEEKEEEEEEEEKSEIPKIEIKDKILHILNDMAEEREGQKYLVLNKLSMKTISELISIAEDLRIPDPASFRRQELIAEIMNRAGSYFGFRLYAEGVFQMIESGAGFLRFSHNNYLQSSDDVFVHKNLIKKYRLRTGDVVAGEITPPSEEKGRYFSLQNVSKINFDDPKKSRERTLFENLIPYYPTKKFNLDWQPDGDISCRVVDIIAPIGKGQRGLIVSPPRAGKTMLLQNIARAILTNHPETFLIVLLIDERPEEVTDWKRNIVEKYAAAGRNVEVISSTFDEKPESHIKVAEIVLAKAKRLTEYGYDVVIFLDSITRLTRAYNHYIPSSGKVLTGGIDSAALPFPKKFFGAARAIEGGGSLTILATCLIDTGSRMDEVIFEEFKGTGNMEIYLDRRIAERRIFPAIDIHRSGTRREELLIPPDLLPKIWILRKSLQPVSTIDAMELLHEKMSRTRTNTEFFELLAKEG